MNIPSVSGSMIESSGAMQQIGIAILGKQLDVVESSGDLLSASLASMPSPALELSVNPHIGSNIDLRI